LCNISCNNRTRPLLSFRLDVGHHQIPQPNKINKLGEDTLYVNPNCIGVFDGVGGWAKEGVDAREYANKLCKGVKEAFETKNLTNPIDILQHAYEEGHAVKGTSTALVLVINKDTLNAANLGDSQFIVVRNLSVILESKEQQIEFNMPFQIGTGSDLQPKLHADKYTLSIQHNDYIVMGSDGLFDNLQTTAMVNSIKKGPKGSCKIIAKDIAQKAYANSLKRNITTPFSKLAKQHNIVWSGGKPDDITVIVAKIFETRKNERTSSNKII